MGRTRNHFPDRLPVNKTVESGQAYDRAGWFPRFVDVLLSPGVLYEKTVDGLCWVLVAVSWSGLILAEAGHFTGTGTLVLAAFLLGSGAFAVAKLSRRSSDPILRRVRSPAQWIDVLTPRTGLEVILVCAVLAAAATIYLQPGEMIFST